MTYKQILKRLSEFHMTCPDGCYDCCGPIMVGKMEKKLGMKAPGWHESFDLQKKCNALDEYGKCTIYETRPVICRLYGITIDGKFLCKKCKGKKMTMNEAQNILNAVLMVNPSRVK